MPLFSFQFNFKHFKTCLGFFSSFEKWGDAHFEGLLCFKVNGFKNLT
jgi:hypothetical protein